MQHDLTILKTIELTDHAIRRAVFAVLDGLTAEHRGKRKGSDRLSTRGLARVLAWQFGLSPWEAQRTALPIPSLKGKDYIGVVATRVPLLLRLSQPAATGRRDSSTNLKSDGLACFRRFEATATVCCRGHLKVSKDRVTKTRKAACKASSLTGCTPIAGIKRIREKCDGLTLETMIAAQHLVRRKQSSTSAGRERSVTSLAIC